MFWIEFAIKPLINLFWLGTTLMVFGGLLALRVRAKKWNASVDTPTADASSTDEAERVSEAEGRPEHAEAPQLRL